jgi:hypothetical protein
MPEAERPSSFDDIAVALSLAAAKLKLDLDQAELLAARIDLSPMGLNLAVTELRKNIDLVAEAHRFFKDNAANEKQIRALVASGKRKPWFDLRKVAVL